MVREAANKPKGKEDQKDLIIMSGLFKFGVVQLNPRLHGDYKAP